MRRARPFPTAIVTDLTKRLFDMRRLIEVDAPIAAGIEKPEGEKGSLAAVHPGAAAYYGDDEKSFMDLYGDWIYIGAMALSGAWIGRRGDGRPDARAGAQGRPCADRSVDRAEAGGAPNDVAARLSELDGQIEELSTDGLRFAREHDFDEAGLSALRLAIDEARRAVDDRCNELQQKSALIANAAATRSLPYPVPSSDS